MEWQSGKLKARLHLTPLPGPCGLQGLVRQLAKYEGPVLLESSAAHESFGRYNIVACEPREILEGRDGKLFDGSGQCLAEDPETFWRILEQAFECVELLNAPDESGKHFSKDMPYIPGWIGYVGYEIGRAVEILPSRAQRDTALPDLRLAFYDALAIFDAVKKTWTLAELEFMNSAESSQTGQTLREILIAAESDFVVEPQLMPDQRQSLKKEPISNFSPAEYRNAVAKCVEYIAAGDIFQVNLSQRFEIAPAPAPSEIYRRLRRRNPAWYSAYLQFKSAGKDCAILSSSPELFLRCRGGHVITRPIKGTRPRCGETARDQTVANELLASEKDNAELAMIIDLLRNDLGRVCRFGSVRVTDPVCLETHPTVFHLVGTVEGELRPGVSQAQLLRATFPGGSITGAPKIRAMEIIDELEPVARGVYTGCVGIVGVDGSAEWNIVIRTIVCDGSRALVQVGGGIVADSTPEGEYLETLDKAKAMLEALAETSEEWALQ